MAACPWCKAAVGDLLAPCPRCGRRADEEAAPSLAGLADVPDLDIPARAPKPAAARPAPKPRGGQAAQVARPSPSQPESRVQSQARIERADREGRADRAEAANNAFADPGARTFEAEEDGLEGGSLDLDLSNGPPLVANPSAAKLQQASPAPAPAGTASPPAPAPAEPLAKAARPGTVEVDAYEARALADYGDPPAAWWKTPQYAYRVLRRRPELKKIADQKRREAERAEGAAEDALLSFAELVRTDSEKLGAYGGAFEAVRATERVLGERDAILAAETDAHKHRQAEHAAKLAALEAQLLQIQSEERQVAGELAEADTLLKRAEARAKRLEIEMRSAIEQAQAAAEPTEAAKGSGA